MPINHELSIVIRDRIRQIRKESGLSQEEFAVVYNMRFPPEVIISQSMLSKMERGVHIPTADKWLKFLAIEEKNNRKRQAAAMAAEAS